LAVSFGYISNSIRGTMNALTASMSSYNQYSIARDLARTAVHTTLRAIDRGIAIPTSGSFYPGSFTVSTYTNVDTLWMTTIGTYGDSSYRMDLKLQMSTKPFFTPAGAMSINAAVDGFTVNGQPTIDGRNHSIDGETLTGSGNLPGITTRSSADSAYVSNHQGQLNLLGSPSGLKKDSSTTDPAPFINEYYQSADYIVNVGDPLPASPWGTVEVPKITFLDAGSDTSQTITLSGNITGCGILVVRGNIKISGSFTFIGLMVVDGTTNVLDFTATGNCSIIGGTIMTGNAVDLTISGTASKGKMYYSSEALDKAKNIGKLRFYKVMEWYE
jgi:hypothetical protein